MADKKSTSQEAHVRAGVSEDSKFVDETDEHGLAVLKVDAGDMPDPEPTHAGPEKMGADPGVFDPNAARRNKLGVGPGLQDSEAKNPAVWVDVDSDESRRRAAEAHVQEAERALKAAKERASALKKGDPLDQEVR